MPLSRAIRAIFKSLSRLKGPKLLETLDTSRVLRWLLFPMLNNSMRSSGMCRRQNLAKKKSFTVCSSFTFRFPPSPTSLGFLWLFFFTFSPGPGAFNLIVLIWVWFESYLPLPPPGVYTSLWHLYGDVPLDKVWPSYAISPKTVLSRVTKLRVLS